MDIITPAIRKCIKKFYLKLLKIPSAEGYTKEIICFAKEEFEKIGFTSYVSPGGTLFIHLPNKNTKQHILFISHVDNIGLVVKSIGKDGIEIATKGYMLIKDILTKEVTIHSKVNKIPKKYNGKITSEYNSMFNNKEKSQKPVKSFEDITIQLQEKTKRKKKRRIEKIKDIEKLGIKSGDPISFKPNINFLRNGIICSRGQDNKISVLILYITGLLLKTHNKKPSSNITIGFNTREETGFPLHVPVAQKITSDITTPDFSYAIAIDGVPAYKELKFSTDDLAICISDNPMHYHEELTTHLLDICSIKKIDNKSGYFKHYGSDLTMKELTKSLDMPCALFGPVIDYMHGEEESDIDTIINSIKLTWHLVTDMPYIQK